MQTIMEGVVRVICNSQIWSNFEKLSNGIVRRTDIFTLNSYHQDHQSHISNFNIEKSLISLL